MKKALQLIFIPIFFATTLAFAGENPYQKLLLQKALQLDLANNQSWLDMLYYEKTKEGISCKAKGCRGFESVIDSPNFFLAKNGKYNPQEELESTLISFFSTENLPIKNVFNQQQTAQCAFKGRFEWLKQKLQFDEKELPTQKCPEFEEWFKEINPKKATFIFSSSYLNNPASMFGHTFLLMSNDENKNNLLLANAINYSANTDETNGITFAFKGLFGLYKGKFSIAPYHQMIKRYNDSENRDLWEYELNLNQEEIRKIMTNLWEVNNNYANYYFFTDNCSYLLLKLLKIAKPEIKQPKSLSRAIIPSDTVIAISQTPNLVGKATYRPSRASKIRHLATQLSKDDLQLAKNIANGKQNTDEFLTISTQENALQQKINYDLAFEYGQYSFQKNNKQSKQEMAQNSLSILKKRSQIAGATTLPSIKIPDSNPANSHKPQRLFVGFGYDNIRKNFTQIDFRPAYHDLLDADSGFLRGAQINVLDLSLRHFSDKNNLKLNHLNIVDIKSYSPIDNLPQPIFWPISWQLKVGIENFYQGKSDYKNPIFAELGAGTNIDLEKVSSNISFLLNGVAYQGDRLPHNNLLGIKPQINFIHNQGESLKLQFNISNNLFFDNSSFNYWQYQIEQNFKLQKNLSIKAGYIRKNFRSEENQDEIVVGINIYF